MKAFGVNGAVAADTEGKKCYRKQQRYKDAIAFEAQIHVETRTKSMMFHDFR